MLRSSAIIILLSYLIITGLSCSGNKSGSDDGNNKKAAAVFDHDLFYSDLTMDFPENIAKADSLALINAFVDQWVRKMLLLHEAEKRKPEALDIDKLVEDYKQSLLINNLEKQVITEELDTFISQTELDKEYALIKENYNQEFPIVRMSYVKIHEETPRIDRFYEWWKKEEPAKINYFCSKYADKCFNYENEWIEWNEIKQNIDPQILKKYSFKKKKNIQKNIGEYEYFIKVISFIDKNEISPLSYIEGRVRNIIIQKRKLNVMDDYIEKLYLKELKNKNIVIPNSKKSNN